MTIGKVFQNIIKIPSPDLEKYQIILGKSGYSLDEIIEYDDGRCYQRWSSEGNSEIILEIQVQIDAQYNPIISEIIDCWFELRAIRTALDSDYTDNFLALENKPPAYAQLLEKISDWEKEMKRDEAMYKIMIKGEVDTAIIAYYLLDEETQQAVLQ